LAQYRRPLGTGQLSTSSYFIDNQLHMYSDFTHFLVDPVHGDQEEQFENRHTIGLSADYTTPLHCAALACALSVGAATRYDALSLGRLPTQARVPLAPQDDPPSFSDLDQVTMFALAGYVQANIRWGSRLRSLFGVRDDYQRGSDVDQLQALHQAAGYSNAGRASQSQRQPKASLIYTASTWLEFYLNTGRGFHSADIRGVDQDRSVGLGLPRTPLLARQEGQELGLRAQPRRDIAFTLALYNLWQQSETIIDPDIGQDLAGPPSRR
jgi:outer membrane receptor protein involved in Fe transport